MRAARLGAGLLTGIGVPEQRDRRFPALRGWDSYSWRQLGVPMLVLAEQGRRGRAVLFSHVSETKRGRWGETIPYG